MSASLAPQQTSLSDQKSQLQAEQLALIASQEAASPAAIKMHLPEPQSQIHQPYQPQRVSSDGHPTMTNQQFPARKRQSTKP